MAEKAVEEGAGGADVAFELQGKSLAGDYSLALMREVERCLPWIRDEAEAGIHMLRAAKSDAGALLLPRRAKLVLRLPQRRVEESMALCGEELTVGSHRVAIGAAKVRPLAPFATLYSHLVAAEEEDEQKFMREMAAGLKALAASCEMICGKRRTLDTGGGEVGGYSLMLHGLSLGHSVLVQRAGLGGKRMLGCGIFVGHKSVVAVS